MSVFGMTGDGRWRCMKNYSHKYFLQRKSCDCNFQKYEKTCFKISGVNGVFDIFGGGMVKYKKV